MSALHWLRPEWLWCFVPLSLLFIYYWFRLRQVESVWDKVVDPQLQPYVIEGDATKRTFAPIALALCWTLIVLMLAGPVWKQQDVPVYRAQQSEVILFDLSASMLSTDIAPDRLTRARFKLGDLLARSQGRQTALIAFTERPYIISPLTEDAKTIEAFLPSLEPAIMPVQGSRLDLAIDRAVDLLTQTSVAQGHIIYIGDSLAGDAEIQAAKAARAAGHRVSVIGVGTASGTPLRDAEGRFMRYADGNIVVPQLDMNSLKSLASTAGGIATELTTDSADLDRLNAVRQAVAIEASDLSNSERNVYWVEFAPWLLWPLLLIALLLFRKGVIA
jgi:Ca-activated chloride channel family protein